MKIYINYPKTFAPLSMAKGSTEHRLHVARLMNLKFFDELQYFIKDREISPNTFKKVLKDTVGIPIKVGVSPSYEQNMYKMSHILNERGMATGYELFIPFTYLNGKIHQSGSLLFLQQTQKFFEEVFNPKFFKRFVTILNKGYNIREIENFYMSNIHKMQKLTVDNLSDFLKNKSVSEQIDTLQFFRYELMKEQNNCKGLNGIEKRIQKYYSLKYERPTDYFEFKDYEFTEKFNIIESKLREIIQSQRLETKNKNSVL